MKEKIILLIRIGFLLCGIGFLAGMLVLTFMLPSGIVSHILRWIIATIGMFMLWNAIRKWKQEAE